MNGRVFSFVRSGNPLVQILSLLVFAVLLAGAVITGFLVIAVMLGLAVILGTVLAVRAWWFRRKLRGRPPESGYEPPPPPGPKPAQKRLIEGEYEVVKQPDAEDARRRR